MIGALAAAALAATVAAQPVYGLWRSPEDGGTLVRIEACGGEICGRIVTSARLRATPEQADIRNRDPALRARRVAGLLILKATPKGPSQWGDGWVYDPMVGDAYSGKLTLTADGLLRMKGCIVAPFCRTQIWVRAQEPASPPQAGKAARPRT